MDIREVRIFKNWWLLMLKGIFIIIVGGIYLSAFYFEDLRSILRIRVLMNSFFTIAILNGVLILFGTFFYKKTNSHWMYWFIEGSFDLLVGITGIILLKFVRITTLNLIFIQIISLWALVHGIIHTLSARRLKNYVPTSKFAFFLGLILIVLSLSLFLKPFYSTIHDYMFIGSSLVIIGILIAAVSIILRKIYSD